MKIFEIASLKVSVLILIGLVGPLSVSAAGPASVDLSSASQFAVLAKSGISTTGATSITGNIGVGPIAASAITGFGLTMDSLNTFSTSPLITGRVYAADYTAPTPTTMTAAIGDMQTAYADAAGRTLPTATELGAGNIGGMTLAPGLYKWSTSVQIPTDVTLQGSASDVWIFQIAQTLDLSSATRIVLSGGAQASNIFWVVAGQTTIGTTAVFNGTILGQTAVVLNTGAVLNGRALAQTAVTLDAASVTLPVSVASTPTATVTPAPVSPVQTPTSIPAPTPVTSNPVVLPSSVEAYSTPAPYVNNPVVTSQPVVITPAAPSSQPANAFGQQVRSIATNLATGSRGNSTKILQEFLMSQNKGAAARALGKVGATGHFGPLTRRALAEFQANVGIRPAVGYFGAITRAYLRAH